MPSQGLWYSLPSCSKYNSRVRRVNNMGKGMGRRTSQRKGKTAHAIATISASQDTSQHPAMDAVSMLNRKIMFRVLLYVGHAHQRSASMLISLQRIAIQSLGQALG